MSRSTMDAWHARLPWLRVAKCPINHLDLALVRRINQLALGRRDVAVAHPLCNVRIGTPAAAIAVPKVWRRSWKRWGRSSLPSTLGGSAA
jgi:hypothetical protein